LFVSISNSQTGSLQITVTGIQSTRGDIKIALYNESGKLGFLKSLDTAYKKKIGKIINLKTTVSFENIPYGIYAVALFHDENLNSELDRAALGYPIEAYGVSGNVQTVGPPRYEDCKFEMKSSFKKLDIKLQTWLKKKQP
jgi:uncharacterized protein (DUF2141 family)